MTYAIPVPSRSSSGPSATRRSLNRPEFVGGSVPLRLRTSIVTLAAASVLGCIDFTGADTRLPNVGESMDLPEPRLEGEVPVERALAARRSVREYSGVPLPLPDLAQLAWAAQGVTDPAGYRTSPSAGALYPVELYLVAGEVVGLEAGVYQYVPAEHRLLRHAGGDARAAVARAALLQGWIADAPAILVLVGFTERSAGKYGDRAPRYVHMEVGHAAQNVYLQAEALGLGTCVVGAFLDGQLKRVLALPETAEPLALLPVGTPR
ncbi:MAG: SagB/ThcOx family dehydrogenase [Myxococcota bacterium]|nr:SagB/ThcOx family dehydrogenase [Myxococcota bacterium]